MSDLTSEEKSLLRTISMAWEQFSELPNLHEWHNVEFMHLIHQMQHMIMARPILRHAGRNTQPGYEIDDDRPRPSPF